MAVILIVDDDASARDLLRTVLGYASHTIFEAQNGAEALILARRLLPDLVIVDLLMPTMNGPEFVRQLRGTEVIATTPVVFYTASYFEREAQNLAEACGVTHIIPKPAEPEQIFAIVNEVLGKTHLPQPSAIAPPEMQQEYLGKLTAALSQRTARVVPRLEAMINLGLQLGSERDPERLLTEFCEAARKIVGAKHALVTIRHPEDAELRYRLASDVASAPADPIEKEFWQSSFHETVLTSRCPRRLARRPNEPVVPGIPARYQSLLCAPIQSPQQVYGSLTLLEPITLEFSDEDEALAQILAAQVGRVYENGSLYNEIKHYAQRLEAEIRERERAQQEIHALNAQLEERIRERTAQLVEANTELEAFGYTVSHDLRAPLRAVSGYSTLLLDSEAEHLSESGKRYLRLNIDNAHRMGRMIDDLLTFSRLGREALTLEPLDMSTLVTEVWSECTQYDRAPAQLDIGQLPPATADRGMLHEVWSNLIANALKYSSKNPTRRVVIAGRDTGGELEYSIRDNGVGFDPAYSHKLFRVFERLHAANEFEGSGAGLAIVERIVRRHGGRVWGESRVGEGATFYFTLAGTAAADELRAGN
jgi:signal transduction histidine kinase/DNA-binding response OmpR family regulator